MSEIEFKEEVFCTLQIEGTHNWPGCPFDEVAYLRDTHRHLFGIKAYKLVTHSDRDVEFIMLKHQIEQYIKGTYRIWTFAGEGHSTPMNGGVCQFGAKSCEMLAKELIKEFGLTRCEVDEDGENGAIVTVV